jgi:hypothetical protein
LLAANRDEIETLLTMLKLRDDWQDGREMAWHLQWLLLKAETRERRRSPDGILLAGVCQLTGYIGQEPRP